MLCADERGSGFAVNRCRHDEERALRLLDGIDVVLDDGVNERRIEAVGRAEDYVERRVLKRESA